MMCQLLDIKEELKKLNPGAEQKLFNQMKFVHCRQKYEIEIPTALLKKKKPDGLVLMSKSGGVERFHTDKLRKLVEEYFIKVDLARDAIAPVCQEILQLFYEHRLKWQRAVAILAELDCLAAISVVSTKENMTRPVFVESPTNQAVLELKGVRNIMLVNQDPKKVVPNDVTLGSEESKLSIGNRTKHGRQVHTPKGSMSLGDNGSNRLLCTC